MKVLIETITSRRGYKFFESKDEMDAYLIITSLIVVMVRLIRKKVRLYRIVRVKTFIM